MAFKENFSIPLIFLTKNIDGFAENRAVDNYHSQMDILNTVLDLLKIQSSKYYLGNSFYKDLLSDSMENKDNKNCILNIQPFQDRFLSFFYENKHYIYNIYQDEFIYYDLFNDPQETNPLGANNFTEIYGKCVNFEE